MRSLDKKASAGLCLPPGIVKLSGSIHTTFFDRRIMSTKTLTAFEEFLDRHDEAAWRGALAE
ncbi:MAG TPA: hypothetical protein VF064_21210, partial [Pyrinomonadaceae bacterium]